MSFIATYTPEFFKTEKARVVIGMLVIFALIAGYFLHSNRDVLIGFHATALVLYLIYKYGKDD